MPLETNSGRLFSSSKASKSLRQVLLQPAPTKSNLPRRREETREISREEGEALQPKRARLRQNEKIEIYQAFAFAK